MDVGRGQKIEDRKVFSKNDLILCTNDATGHDMRYFIRTIINSADFLSAGTQNIKRTEKIYGNYRGGIAMRVNNSLTKSMIISYNL